MLSLLAVLAIHQLPLDRLRTILPNNSAILVDRLPKQPLISVQLIASSKYTPETSETHGYRHLLEHLIARGKGHDLDKRLESQGAFLRASTYRDAMQVQISCTPEQLDLALSAIKDVLEASDFTQADLDREKAAIDQEIGLEDDANLIANAAWTQAYGDSGLDAVGDIATIRKATIEDMRIIRLRQFAPPAVAISIAGDVDVDIATAKARAVLVGLPPIDMKPAPLRGEGLPGRIECSGFGEARAAICRGFGSVNHAVSMAAAFALASDFDDVFVTYTPTTQWGVITLGRTEQTSGLGLAVDAMDIAKFSPLVERGKYFARLWLQRQLDNPAADAFLRGLLISQRHSAEPEDFVKALDLVDEMTFEEGVAAFYKAQSVTVVGIR